MGTQEKKFSQSSLVQCWATTNQIVFFYDVPVSLSFSQFAALSPPIIYGWHNIGLLKKSSSVFRSGDWASPCQRLFYAGLSKFPVPLLKPLLFTYKIKWARLLGISKYQIQEQDLIVQKKYFKVILGLVIWKVPAFGKYLVSGFRLVSAMAGTDWTYTPSNHVC